MRSKVAIIIAGNIASGKTSLAKELLKHLHDFTHLSMDIERFAATAKGLEREQQAEQSLIAKVLQTEHIIYETTAFGKVYKVIDTLLIKHRFKIIRLKLICSPDECLRRYQERVHHPPMPFKFEIEDSLWKIHQHLEGFHATKLDSQHYSPEEIATQIL